MATVSESMATKLSDLDDQKPGFNIQLMATPSHYPVAGMALKRQRHLVAPHHVDLCSLWWGNQNLTTLRLGIAWKYRWSLPKMGEWHHHSPHTWQMPVVEDIVQDGKSGLMEAVVTSPGQTVLFYGWWSLGEGLALGEGSLIHLARSHLLCGKQALLSANSISLGEGQQLISQAITKKCIKPRGPGHPHSIPPVSTPFIFSNQGWSP